MPEAPTAPAVRLPLQTRRDPLGDLAAEQAGERSRDVLSELMAEEMPLSSEERSTQSVMDELLRLGADDGEEP